MTLNIISEHLRPDYYFDLALMDFKELFDGVSCVWEAVKRIQDGVVEDIARVKCDAMRCYNDFPCDIIGVVDVRVAAGAKIGPRVAVMGEGGLLCVDEEAEIYPGTMIITGKNAVYIGRGVKIGPNAHIDARKGAVCIGDQAVLRQGSYLRELSLLATKAVVGNSCEIKCSLIGREAEVPHFNYVGDSILGYKSHLGAGVKISNLKITPDPEKINTVKLRCNEKIYDTGMRKFGIILGDKAQIGCNSVTNPGSLVGKNSLVYTGSNIVGFVPSNTIVKLRQNFEYVEMVSNPTPYRES